MRKAWLDLLVFVLFLNLFMFRGLGSVALWLVIAGLWMLLIRVFETSDKVVRWTSSAVLAISLVTYMNVSSPEKAVLLILVSLLTMISSVYIWLKQERIGGILELGLSGLLVVKAYLQSWLRILRAIVVGKVSKTISLNTGKNQPMPWAKSLLTGVLVGLPLVTWLLFTLSKADPIFAAFVRDVVSERLLNELPWRLAISLFIFVILIPLMFMRIKGYVSPLGWLSRVRWGREMAVVTGMVVVVLGTFLVVQWPYVFASVAKETELIKYGVATYSEYVTKGFWDLLKVVVMVFGVAWASLLLSKNQTGNGRKWLLSLQGILGVEFVVFVASIFRRVWLYQNYHGLSLARLYGLALLIALVGMMVTMALRYVYGNLRWVKVEIAWILVVVFGSIWINMESLVVQNPPTVNGRVDYVYLSRLSGDGYGGWKLAYDHVGSKLDELAKAKLPGVGIDNRREVYYGELVLNQLIQNYDRLIWRYGSEDEIKSYLQQILDFEQVMLIKYPEIATVRVSGGRDEIQGVIENTKRQLAGDEWGKTGIVVRPSARQQRGNYIFAGYEAGFYGLVSHGLTENRRLQNIDLLWSYHPEDREIFERMKVEIPVSGLLQAVENYWILRLQIITQPETERVVPVDISLDSPFVQ